MVENYRVVIWVVFCWNQLFLVGWGCLGLFMFYWRKAIFSWLGCSTFSTSLELRLKQLKMHLHDYVACIGVINNIRCGYTHHGKWLFPW